MIGGNGVGLCTYVLCIGVGLGGVGYNRTLICPRVFFLSTLIFFMTASMSPMQRSGTRTGSPYLKVVGGGVGGGVGDGIGR